jgi:1,4-dihydroxy-2-naphthoate octaprenyltransferase
MSLLDYVKALKVPLYFTSIAPVLLGWAIMHWKITFIIALLFIVVVTMQAALNISMDYFDNMNGRKLKNADTFYPIGSYFIEKMGFKPEKLRKSFVILTTIAVITGLFTVYITRNIVLLYLGLTAVFLSLLYVIPPFKLGARGIGEIATFFSFGPFPLLGTVIALGGTMNREYIFLSVSLGLLASAIRFLHHIPEDRIDGNRVKNFRTIYGFMTLGAAVILLPFRVMIIPSMVLFFLALIQISFLPRNIIKISRQTNIIVGLHFLFTLLVIAALSL